MYGYVTFIWCYDVLVIHFKPEYNGDDDRQYDIRHDIDICRRIWM